MRAGRGREISPQHKRGRRNRTRRKYMLIAAEGNNKTERFYIERLAKDQKTFVLKFISGLRTDAPGLVRKILDEKNSIPDWTKGDKAIVLSDLDTEKYKQTKAEEAIRLADKNNIQILFSTPCFEIWFLFHFRYSTREYSDNREVIEDLRKYVRDYQKTIEIVDFIQPMQSDAIERAKRAEAFHVSVGRQRWDRNSGSEVYKLVEMLVCA